MTRYRIEAVTDMPEALVVFNIPEVKEGDVIAVPSPIGTIEMRVVKVYPDGEFEAEST